MGAGSRKRWRVVVPLGALALMLGAAGALALVRWQRYRLPWRTVHLTAVPSAILLGSEGRTLLAQRPDRLLSYLSDPVWDLHPRGTWDVFSLESGRLERTVERVEDTDARPGFLRETFDHGLERFDPATGLATRVKKPWETGEGTLGDHACLAPSGDAVALVHRNRLEVRSVEGVVPARSVFLRQDATDFYASSLVFSPRGDVLGLGRGMESSIWTLARPDLPRVVEGDVLGFSRRGEPIVHAGLMPARYDKPVPVELSVLEADDKTRVVARALDDVYALSASGELIAAVEPSPGGFAVVVRSLETGVELRRLEHATGSPDVRGLALSAEGERLAIVDAGGLVEVWELPPS